MGSLDTMASSSPVHTTAASSSSSSDNRSGTSSAAAVGSRCSSDIASDGSSSGRRTTNPADSVQLQRRLSDSVREVWLELGYDSQSGAISAQELSDGLARLGLATSPLVVREIFAEADVDTNGLLDHDELLGYVRKREEEIKASFARLTPQRALARVPTDEIAFADLKESLAALGVKTTDREIAVFLAQLDRKEGQRGMLSLHDYASFVYRLPHIDVAAAFESWLAARGGGLDTGAEPGQVESSSLSSAATASSEAVFLSGAVAGVISRTATAPLDRLKMLMQVGTKWAPVRPAGVLDGLRAIYAQGGFHSFFQGNTANVVKVMPESGVKFWAYDSAKLFLCGDPRHPRVGERLLAGAFAGASSCVAIYPLEVAKTRLAVASAGTYHGLIDCLRSTVRAEGLGALYKGLGASLVGIIPFSAVDLALYNTFKAELRYHRRSEPGTLTMLACGALSSSLAQLATYPLALAKTRLQASGMPGFTTHYNGLLGCLIDTVRTDGLKGLYRDRAQPAQGRALHLYLLRRVREHQGCAHIEGMVQADPRVPVWQHATMRCQSLLLTPGVGGNLDVRGRTHPCHAPSDAELQTYCGR